MMSSTRPSRPPMRRANPTSAAASEAFQLTAKQIDAQVAGNRIGVRTVNSTSIAPISNPSSVEWLESDREKQVEELEVLQAVYGDEMEILQPIAALDAVASDITFASVIRIRLSPILVVEVRVPFAYPSSQHPVLSLSLEAHTNTTSGKVCSCAGSAPSYRSTVESLSDEFPCGDEVLIFQLLEALKERVLEAEVTRRSECDQRNLQRHQQLEREEHASLLAAEELIARELAAEDGKGRVSNFDEGAEGDAAQSIGSGNRFSAAVEAPPILTGEPLTDRKSTFQAHVATVRFVAESHAMLAELYSHNKIARATHNMWAYVIRDPSTGVVRRENDDDGEDQAGGRLAHLLQIMQVSNTMVVVSRWYGGIQLGPDRFKHINNVARLGIEAHLKSNEDTDSNSSSSNSHSKDKKASSKPQKR